jgi:hypothetical protein
MSTFSFTIDQLKFLDTLRNPLDRREARRTIRRIWHDKRKNRINYINWEQESIIKKAKEQIEIRKELEKKKDQDYYKKDRNYIKGFTIINNFFAHGIKDIPPEILKLIWQYVLDLVVCHQEMKPIMNIACIHCGLNNIHNEEKCCMCMNLFVTNYNYLLGRYEECDYIMLMNRNYELYYKIHKKCLLNAGLTFHDREKCDQTAGYDKRYHEITGCYKCIESYYYQLEYIETSHKILDVTDEKKFCQLPKYINYRYGDKGIKDYDQNELDGLKDEIPTKHGDKYHIRDRKRFDVLNTHNAIFTDKYHCMSCYNGQLKFSLGGIRLCTNIECHLKLGIAVRKLGIFR